MVMNLRSQNVRVACDQTYLSFHTDVVTLECERKYVIVCVCGFFWFYRNEKIFIKQFNCHCFMRKSDLAFERILGHFFSHTHAW